MKNQILTSESGWVDKCQKTVFSSWTIPQEIREHYQDGQQRKFKITVEKNAYEELCSISSGQELLLKSSTAQKIADAKQKNPNLEVKFEGLDLATTGFFWVNLGNTYKEVETSHNLWAPYSGPQYGKPSVTHWLTMEKLKPGDVIFAHKEKEVFAILTATSIAVEADKPSTYHNENSTPTGNQVSVEILMLKTPIPTELFKDSFYELYNEDCTPKVFTEKLQCSQTYLCKIPEGAAHLILGQTEELLLDINPKTSKDNRPTKNLIKGSEVLIMAKARVGHDKFRMDLEKFWDNKCAVLGIKAPDSFKGFLIASHIVPWSTSDDYEKVSKFNGLLLSPHIDKLFDRGLISFEDTGVMIYKPECEKLLQALNIPLNSKLQKIHPEHIPFLTRHRSMFKF